MPLSAAFHATFLSLLAERSPVEVADVIQPLVDRGDLDLRQAVLGKYARAEAPLLAHWLPQVSLHQITPRDLALLSTWAGDGWWNLPTERGPALLTAWIQEKGNPPTKALWPVVDHLPRAFWATWAPPPGRHHARPKGQTAESELVLWMLQADRSRDLRDTQPLLGDGLVERGFDLTGQTSEGPVATYLGSPLQWNAFLAQGGDPFQVVSVGLDEEAREVPLWMALRDDHRGDLRQTIEAWALARPDLKQQAEKDAVEKYFKDVQRQSNLNEMAKAIRARTDWPTLQNAQGQSVFMSLLASTYGWKAAQKNLIDMSSQVKGRAVLPLLDQEGRSLWHYLLARGEPNHTVDETLNHLLASGLAPAPDRHGRGLLLQGLSPIPEARRSLDPQDLLDSQALALSWSLPKVKAALASPRIWLQGPVEDQRRLITWMVNERSVASEYGSSLVGRIHKLAQALAPNGVDPFWLGAFVVNACLDTTIKYTNYHADVAAWQAQGAVFQLSPERQAKLQAHAQKHGASEWLDQVLTANAQNLAIYQRTQDRQADLQARPSPTRSMGRRRS